MEESIRTSLDDNAIAAGSRPTQRLWNGFIAAAPAIPSWHTQLKRLSTMFATASHVQSFVVLNLNCRCCML